MITRPRNGVHQVVDKPIRAVKLTPRRPVGQEHIAPLDGHAARVVTRWVADAGWQVRLI